MTHRAAAPVLTFVMLLALQCSARDDAAAPPHAVPACAELSGPQCFPKASCGCFGRECVAGRVEPVSGGDDHFVVERGPQTGETGILVEVCPNAVNGLAECVTYVELSRTCTVVCSDPPDRFSDPGYRCGFIGGECAKLGAE